MSVLREEARNSVVVVGFTFHTIHPLSPGGQVSLQVLGKAASGTKFGSPPLQNFKSLGQFCSALRVSQSEGHFL